MLVSQLVDEGVEDGAKGERITGEGSTDLHRFNWSLALRNLCITPISDKFALVTC